MAGSIRTVVQNSVFIGGGLILGNISSLLFRLVIARVYGPSSFGVFSIGFMVVSVTTTIALFGLPAGVTRYVSRYRSIGKEQHIPLVLGVSVAISLALSALFTFLLVIWAQPLALDILQSPDSARFIRWFAFQIPANTLILLTAAFALGHERGGIQVAIKEIMPKLLVLGFTLWIVAIRGTIFDVGIGYVITRWVAAIIGITATLHLLTSSNLTKFSITDSFNEARELLVYSSPLLLTTFTGFFLNWIDTFFVAFYLSDSTVGLYQSAFILGTSLSLFFSAISESLFPNFSALLREENEDEIIQRYAEGVRWSLVISTAPFVYLLVFPETSLGMLFGPEFSAVGTPMVIILTGQFVVITIGPATGVLKSTGNTQFIFKTYLLAALANLVGNYALIPKIGLIGAALSTGTATVFQSFVLFYKAKSDIDLKLPLQRTLRPIISGGISGSLCFTIFSTINTYKGFFLSIITFSSIYFVMLIFTGSVSRKEMKLALKTVR